MSEVKQLSGGEGIKKIGELIQDIKICMMTTAVGDGSFDSRPMATQNKKFDGNLWFLTKNDSGKVRELANDDHIGLMYSNPDDSSYVAIKGIATVGRDQTMIHELWNPMYKAWFPEGETDPSITVLRVRVTEAQYWEASSSKLVMGVKYLAAAITGGKVDVGETGKLLV